MRQFEKMLASIIVVASLMASGAIAFALSQAGSGDKATSHLASFSTREELSRFVIDAQQNRQGIYYDFAPNALRENSPTSALQPSYSQTNVQVAGIDELDTVKTDGRYIYVTNGSGVSIVKAYPPEELSNVSHIDKSDLIPGSDGGMSVSFVGLFVLPGKLITVTSSQEQSYWYNDAPIMFTRQNPATPWSTVSIFNMKDAEHPRFEYSAGVTGWPITARLIGNTVYLIAQSYILVEENQTIVPETAVGINTQYMPLSKIHYDPEMKDASAYTNILAVDADGMKQSFMSVITGYSSTLYMSMQAIYLTVQKWTGDLVQLDSGVAAEEASTASTTIYKISFDGLSMRATGSGDVKGWLLNQFSMDEDGTYLRVATTTSWTQPSSAVYVLNEDLKTIGSLEGIAPNERIYSARFVGDTLYLVTFRQIDPLFVIDLSVPGYPRVAGELTIPGFSTYLHPVDDNHILGIGSENGSAKVSLYDVSDRSNPIEVSKWILTDYQWSSAIYDHKEVLFDSEKGLLVVPITAQSWQYSYTNSSSESRTINGEFVFNVSAGSGISLRGIVEFGGGTSYYGGLRRALYIGDYLYTISSTTIKVNLLSDLSEVGSITYCEGYFDIYPVMVA